MKQLLRLRMMTKISKKWTLRNVDYLSSHIQILCPGIIVSTHMKLTAD